MMWSSTMHSGKWDAEPTRDRQEGRDTPDDDFSL
jgi:hypothetical protein